MSDGAIVRTETLTGGGASQRVRLGSEAEISGINDTWRSAF